MRRFLAAAFEGKYGVKLKTWRANSEKGLQPLRSPHLKDLMPQARPAHGHWVGTRINMFAEALGGVR